MEFDYFYGPEDAEQYQLYLMCSAVSLRRKKNFFHIFVNSWKRVTRKN